MYQRIKPFGIHVNAKTIGEGWMDLIEAVLQDGKKTYDEGRGRLSLQNVRIRISCPKPIDPILKKFADRANLDAVIYLTFKGEEMYDFDVIPSFSPGAKSYYGRLKEGRMIEYVIKRLSLIPESKKGVISFIHWDDYKAVLDTPYDDYLPCILVIQIRLLKQKGHFLANINWMARSLDIFQKGNGNIVAITMIANKIIKKLKHNLKTSIKIQALDGFITDVHIYNECLEKARETLKKYCTFKNKKRYD